MIKKWENCKEKYAKIIKKKGLKKKSIFKKTKKKKWIKEMRWEKKGNNRKEK